MRHTLVSALAGLTWCLAAMAEADGTISGVVLNGTQERRPLADAEVVLRSGSRGVFEPIASTQTDDQGRFSFAGLPADGRTIFLPGANRDGVHFPGSRLRLDPSRPTAEIELVAYDAIAAPSPLVARSHDLAIRAETGFLEIGETLTIDNPSRTAYVGETPDDRPPITLRLHLPPGFETVTFDQEFLGRSFLVHDGKLVSDLPWPPGQRVVKFTYRLPVEQRSSRLRRELDLPTDRVTLRVHGGTAPQLGGQFRSNSPTLLSVPAASATNGDEIAFASHSSLPAGHIVELRIGELPVRWEVVTRWATIVVFVVLVAATVIATRRHRRTVVGSVE